MKRKYNTRSNETNKNSEAPKTEVKKTNTTKAPKKKSKPPTNTDIQELIGGTNQELESDQEQNSFASEEGSNKLEGK